MPDLLKSFQKRRYTLRVDFIVHASVYPDVSKPYDAMNNVFHYITCLTCWSKCKNNGKYRFSWTCPSHCKKVAVKGDAILYVFINLLCLTCWNHSKDNGNPLIFEFIVHASVHSDVSKPVVKTQVKYDFMIDKFRYLVCPTCWDHRKTTVHNTFWFSLSMPRFIWACPNHQKNSAKMRLAYTCVLLSCVFDLLKSL